MTARSQQLDVERDVTRPSTGQPGTLNHQQQMGKATVLCATNVPCASFQNVEQMELYCDQCGIVGVNAESRGFSAHTEPGMEKAARG